MESATVKYARQLYAELFENSELLVLPDGSEHRVFRGKLTEMFHRLKASQTYYSPIRKLLLEEECIDYVERGTRATPSVIVLYKPLPEDVEIPPIDLTPGPTLATLSARVDGLEAQRDSLGGLNIGEALRQMEKRLSQLENLAGDKERNGKT